MAADLVAKNFDYSTLEKDAKGKLIALSGQWQRTAKGHITSGLELGAILREAQAILSDYRGGTFVAWIESEIGVSTSTAYELMNSSELADSFPGLGKLKIGSTALSKLAATSTPKAAVEKAVKLGEKGVALTEKAVKKIIAEAKAEADGAPEKRSPAATEFDPANLPPAPEVKPPKAGQPVTSSALRVEAIKQLDAFGRTLTKLGIYNEFIRPLSQIRERIKAL